MKLKIIIFLSFSLITITSLLLVVQIMIPDNEKYDYKKAQKYTNKLINLLDKERIFEIEKVFNFEFKRGYVFYDSYNDGEAFARYNNLDINIECVKPLDSQYIRRIVFVDNNGDFVYEYRYKMDELEAKNEGVIIYPNTKIQKSESIVDGAIGFEFLNIKPEEIFKR